jgi:hypothetical protein
MNTYKSPVAIFTLCQGVTLRWNGRSSSENHGYTIKVDGIPMGVVKARAYDEHYTAFPSYTAFQYHKMTELFGHAKQFLCIFDSEFNKIHTQWHIDLTQATRNTSW